MLGLYRRDDGGLCWRQWEWEMVYGVRGNDLSSRSLACFYFEDANRYGVFLSKRLFRASVFLLFRALLITKNIQFHIIRIIPLLSYEPCLFPSGYVRRTIIPIKLGRCTSRTPLQVQVPVHFLCTLFILLLLSRQHRLYRIASHSCTDNA